MLNGGEHLREEQVIRGLYRREDIVEMLEEADEFDCEDADIGDIVPVCHPDFKIVLTTTMPYAKLDDFHFHTKYGLPAERACFNIQRFGGAACVRAEASAVVN